MMLKLRLPGPQKAENKDISDLVIYFSFKLVKNKGADLKDCTDAQSNMHLFCLRARKVRVSRIKRHMMKQRLPGLRT